MGLRELIGSNAFAGAARMCHPRTGRTVSWTV